ncbi:MAG: hypothetical protein QOE60_1734, partial [Thermoleophilaceae bacterium]|nr:hypothetical protein [Thermoleophilaceae bacterium]
GGKGADTITGTENADYIMGFGGADTINGLGGGDTLVADTTAATDCSADALDGAGGEDTLWLGGHTTANAGAGNDRIVAGGIDCAGAGDVVHGGDDLDQADFGLVTAPGLTVSLDGGVLPNDGFGGADNYDADVEDLFAGDHGMTLIGNEKANHLVGGAGNDLLDGGLGADQLDGGGGIDTADYSKRALPLTLTIGVGNDDGETGEGDSISADVENLRGGLGSDVLTGNVLDNVLDGGPGADNISGGDGIDAVDYTRRAAAVNVTLNAGAGNDGEAGENDTIASDVEGAFGGAGNDKLVGAVGNGFLFGFAGNDDLSDVGGADTLDAGTGDDVINSVDGAVDHDVCGPGIDKATADPTDTVDADCTDTTSPPPGPPTPPSPPSPPSQPGPPGPPAPPVVPIDHTAPNATLALGTSKLGKLLSGGLKLSVRPSETGTVRAVLTAESTTARALQRRGVKGVLASGQANATGGATKTLTLRLGRKARRALSGSAVAKFKLLVTVTDAAGNKRTLTKHLKIKG